MNWYTDPGHGWLKVSVKALFKAGVVNKISHYSYIRGKYAYLEEDCDAAIYLDAIDYPRDEEIPSKHTNRHSKIRSYDGYTWPRAIVATDDQGLLKV